MTNKNKKELILALGLMVTVVFSGCSSGGQPQAAPQVAPRAEVRTTVIDLVPATLYTTKAYIYEAATPGPAAMVVGGIHGNEPAGAAAAEKFLGISLLKGTLIVIPRANELALLANQRTLPEIEDLNRAYPGKKDGTPAQQITYDIVQLMKKYQVSMVIDLHEGYAFNYENHQSVGETILPGKDDTSILLAMDAVQYINENIQEDKKKFTVLANPIAGSTADYANTVLKVSAFTIETSGTQPLEDRVNFSFNIAKFLLASQGVIEK